MKIEVSRHIVDDDQVDTCQFLQSDGSKVLNTVSDSADGQIYMTFQFEVRI